MAVSSDADTYSLRELEEIGFRFCPYLKDSGIQIEDLLVEAAIQIWITDYKKSLPARKIKAALTDLVKHGRLLPK